MTKIQRIKKWMQEADAILVGASNGLSITEGFHIFANDMTFQSMFGDFSAKYGLRCTLDGMFFHWPCEEEKWAFYSRLIQKHCLEYQGSQTMDALKTIIGDKPYFIVTSNGENHFELAGFDPENILEIEGKVPTNLIPRCPKCGGTMRINDRAKGEQMKGYQTFLETYHGKKILVLELGIGARNQLIKAPLMNLVYGEDQAKYLTVNKGEIYIPDAIKEKSIGVDGLLGDVLPNIAMEIEH